MSGWFARFDFPQLYVITEEGQIVGNAPARTHEAVVRAAVDGGARIVQIRDKSGNTRRILQAVERCLPVVEEVEGLLCVNDRVDVAMASGAHGVHLGDEDLPVAVARKILGDQALIGASVATIDQAQDAVRAEADYVSVGAIFPTQTKPDAGEPLGLERIADIKRRVDVPVAAIGGIHTENIAAVVEAGADFVCVVSAVTRALDMRRATQELIQHMAGVKHP